MVFPSDTFMRSIAHGPAACMLTGAEIHFMICQGKVFYRCEPGAFMTIIAIGLVF